MKKLFIALLFSAVLFIGLPFYNVYAMPITYDVPFSNVPDTLGLLEDILNGGKINIKDMTSVEDVLEHYRETVGAKNFLSRQANILSAKLSKMAIDGELTINPNNNLVIPITISDLAYRMGYNPYWYQQYVGETTVYPEITERVNICSCKAPNLPTNGYSYTAIGYYANGFSFQDPFGSTVYNGCKYPFTYVSLHEGTWDYLCVVGYQLQGTANIQGNRGVIPVQDGISGSNFVWSSDYPLFINLSDALNYSRSGTLTEDSLISAPDVIQVGDTPEWTYDVFFPKVEGLEGLSINQFLEWLQGQLDDPDVNFVDLGMLIADAVPLLVIDDDDPETTPTTRPITLDDTRPVIDVIEDDPIAPTPTPDPDNPTSTPFPLPPIPTFPIPSDIPGVGIPVDHTVLAEIVDATQNVVPQELMALIWSTFGLLVVGGLIYILHK